MDDNVTGLLQAQMNRERYNSQVYQYIAAQFQNQAFDGFAKFFRHQAQEEMGHAQMFIDFLVSKRIAPVFASINAISFGDVNPATLAERTYGLEQSTTSFLNSMYGSAEDENEYQVCALLDKLLVEQIEEETWSYDLFDLLSKSDYNGWILLDKEYGAKV